MKNWDLKQKQDFTNAMGKRQKFARGGMVKRRKYFDTGGTVLGGPSNITNTNAVNPNTGVLGTIGGALGTNDNFQAGSANIQAGTSAAQLNNAYTGAQGGIGMQNTVAGALTPQATSAVTNQNAAADTEQNILNGTGPNVALNQLNQTTGQNIAATGAAMAGARGSSGNVGLMARQIGQQGAATQQAAVGQAATNEATQQQTAATNLAGIGANQASQATSAATAANTAEQNEQNILQGANTAYNNAGVGMQSNINNVNATTAAANQQENNGILNDVTGGLAGGISSIFAKGGEVKEPHMQLAEMNAHSLKKFADGGPAYAPIASGGSGGPNIQATPNFVTANPLQKPKKQSTDNEPTTTTGEAQDWSLGGGLAGGSGDAMDNAAPASAGSEMFGDLPIAALLAARGGEIEGPHQSQVANFLFAKGGAVPAMVSEGEVYLSPEQVTKVINEGADPKKIGTHIKAQNKSQRAKVKGDSYSNDKIPVTLEDGGVVVDRKNMKSAESRKLFVHESIARKKAGTR